MKASNFASSSVAVACAAACLCPATVRGAGPSVLALTGDRDVAADAADEAMVRAYERWDRVSRMSSPSSWATQVALNVVRAVNQFLQLYPGQRASAHNARFKRNIERAFAQVF